MQIILKNFLLLEIPTLVPRKILFKSCVTETAFDGATSAQPRPAARRRCTQPPSHILKPFLGVNRPGRPFPSLPPNRSNPPGELFRRRPSPPYSITPSFRRSAAAAGCERSRERGDGGVERVASKGKEDLRREEERGGLGWRGRLIYI